MIMFASIFSYAQYDSIPHDGMNRTFLLHLPIGYNDSTDIPLIVAMHGGFGNAYSIENQSQLSAKADVENFIVVYPEGVVGGVLNISSWNAGWCCGYASNSNVDDIGFIDALLDTLINLYAVDTNRIYATGMSNGGFLTYRLGCELSERIAAIAPVAASMSMVDCIPSRPIPLIDLHSYLDTHIPYDGGIGSGPSNHYNPPQDSVLNFWAENSNCLDLNDTIVHNSQYTFIKWTSCDCNSEVHHYITQDGGHSWPGVSNFIDATDLIWSFFQQYTLECSTLSISNDVTGKNKIFVYPNPTSDIITLKGINSLTDVSYIHLLDNKGALLKKIGINETQVDLSSFSPGIYFLEIKHQLGSGRIKIIKQ